MLKLLFKNWFHFIIWPLMIVYIFIAPGFVDNASLKYGRPIELSVGDLKTSDMVVANADELQAIDYDSQYLYSMLGWAFSAADPNVPIEDYTRYLLLQSDSHKYYFVLEAYARPDIETGFRDIALDLTNSGFKAMIAKEFIAPGKYKIGILFRSPNTGQDYFVWTQQHIIRTSNQISLSKNALN